MSFVVLSWNNIESRIRLARPIILSHEPPKWEACGGLKVHVQPCLDRYSLTAALSMFDGIFNSLHAPTKLVPRSEQILLTGP